VTELEAIHYRWADIPLEMLNPLLGRRMISSERMTIAQIQLEKGCLVPRHSHENEQLAYILEGSLRFWLGEENERVVELGAGEMLHIPSYLPHRAEALETTLDLDIFCPPRQDWLDGGDSYLRSQ
jgi:quercetin dioxygenase-like cupin family protein